MSDDHSSSDREARKAAAKAKLLEQFEHDWAQAERLAALYPDAFKIIQSGNTTAIDERSASPAAKASAADKRENRAFDGTISGLITCYQSHPESAYKKVRYKTRESYDTNLRRLGRDLGSVRIENLDSDCVWREYEKWKEVSGASMAHGLVTMLRGLATFGSIILKDRACREFRVALHDLSFPAVRSPAKERLTAEHAKRIRACAHKAKRPSIALAQALQFDCELGQKDVIGEWVPRTEPGVEYLVDGENKWLRGLRWEEIDNNLILRHATTRGSERIEIDLKSKRMVMEEFALIVDGSKMPPKGPIINFEHRNRPYRAHEFRREWRTIARSAGVPDNVFNRDSSAGEESQEYESESAQPKR